MAVVVAVLAWCLAFALAIRPGVPWWAAFAVCVALSAIFVTAYARELHPGAGDGQPRLVAVFGIVAVAIAVVLVMIGLGLRRRR